MADDDQLSRRYRELPREEPPRHLDEAILAAARRAVHTRPAPLVVPSGRQRWYFPLAAAAIIVLAVAVTVHMQGEQPAEELMSVPTAPAPAAPAVAPPLRDQRADAAAPTELQKAPEAAPLAKPERRVTAEGARAAASLSALAAQSPEQWLQGIADLRRQGRHAEADKELAEFRKRYADYRISPELREQVERSTR